MVALNVEPASRKGRVRCEGERKKGTKVLPFVGNRFASALSPSLLRHGVRELLNRAPNIEPAPAYVVHCATNVPHYTEVAVYELGDHGVADLDGHSRPRLARDWVPYYSFVDLCYGARRQGLGRERLEDRREA